MKSLKIWSLVVLFAMALVGCGKDNDDAIVGQWHLTSWNDSKPEFEVYVEFKDGGQFNIYQQVWTLRYEHYTGTYSANKGVLSGNYSDGSSWLASYQYTLQDGVLKLYNNGEVSVYRACAIPAEVINEAAATRSEGVVPFL